MEIIKFFYSTDVTIYHSKLYVIDDQIHKEVCTVDKTFPRITICGICDGETWKFGIAKCSPDDQFVRKVGREIAKERAMSKPIVISVTNHDRCVDDFYTFVKNLDPARYLKDFKFNGDNWTYLDNLG